MKPKLPFALFLVLALLQSTAVSVTTGQNPDDVEEKATVRFVDSQGISVSKVKAYWYRDGKSKRVSPTDGVAKIPSGSSLVVAKKEGYQFSGLLINEKTTPPFSVVMLGEEEPGPAFATLPVPVESDLKKKLVEKFKAEFWDQLKSNPKDPRNISQCIGVLVRLAPEETMEFFEKNPGGTMTKMLVKQELVRSLAATDFEAAAEIADSIEDPMQRSILLNFLMTSSPSNSAALSAIEAEVTNSIKDIPQPAYRYAAWSMLAEHYLNTDRSELADKIVDQNIEDVKKLPAGGWSGFPRSLFAALIVARDPDLAAELVKGMDKNENDRALGRLAFHCCRTHPKKAIEFLEQIKPRENSIVGSAYAIKICHRMAVEHTEDAFELAETIEEKNQRAWAYGLMARRLNATQPEQAKLALIQATNILATSSNVKDGAWLTPASTAAGLLPIVEKVAPEKISSVIWESVYLAIPRSRWNLGGGSKSSRIQSAAAAISRYDLAIAKTLVGGKSIEIGSDAARAATNQVALDAAKLPDFLEGLNSRDHASGLKPRSVAVGMLTGTDENFWNAVSKPSFLEWGSEKFEDH